MNPRPRGIFLVFRQPRPTLHETCAPAVLVAIQEYRSPPVVPHRHGRATDSLERVPLLWKRNTLSILSFAHVLVGEPASTSPEHALDREIRLSIARDNQSMLA
jgi:hypothetical protein